ncbi:hypothetical protein DL96DRAFT_1823455 [Flagelloscypha sp. PMI_526]|nr:hypothetical protein DL96DRAFT_1823455 [Flagelloscypha sp. PMI_526]
MTSLKPRSTASATCCVSALGLDVLTEICHFVSDTSRPDIFSLLLVNVLFHDVALPFSVRSCALNFEVDEVRSSHNRITCWLKPGGREAWVLANIHHFTIYGTPGEAGLRKELDLHFNGKEKKLSRTKKWAPVLRLLPSIHNLRSFTFACPRDRIPADLLHLLEDTHPHMSLTVKHWGVGGGRDASNIVVDPDEEALAASPLLRHIEMDHHGGPWDVSYIVLQWILARSRHLESLTVNSRVERIGRTCGNAWRTGGEQKRRAATIFTLPPILQKQKFRRLHLLPSPVPFADFSIRIEDPSSLEDLQCFFPLPSLAVSDFFHQLTSLRHLKLEIGQPDIPEDVFPHLIEFLDACGPLETLSLSYPSGLQAVLLSAMTRHGPTLDSLSILCTPKYTSDRPVIPSSVGDITLIEQHCPHLRSLALTSTRCQTHSDISQALGRLSSLSEITLVFPEEPRGTDRWGSYYGIFAEMASLDGNDVNYWEAALWLQLPVHSDFGRNIFKDIRAVNHSFEKLTLRLGDKELRKTAQEFVIRLGVDGGVKIETLGYHLPEYVQIPQNPDPQGPKLQRLRQLWDALDPNTSMPVQLQQPIPST